MSKQNPVQNPWSNREEKIFIDYMSSNKQRFDNPITTSQMKIRLRNYINTIYSRFDCSFNRGTAEAYAQKRLAKL